MTLEELKAALKTLGEGDQDPESAHCKADSLLLKFINDDEVTDLFDKIEKWYA